MNEYYSSARLPAPVPLVLSRHRHAQHISPTTGGLCELSPMRLCACTRRRCPSRNLSKHGRCRHSICCSRPSSIHPSSLVSRPSTHHGALQCGLSIDSKRYMVHVSRLLLLNPGLARFPPRVAFCRNSMFRRYRAKSTGAPRHGSCTVVPCDVAQRRGDQFYSWSAPSPRMAAVGLDGAAAFVPAH